jgi:hypothetical protein
VRGGVLVVVELFQLALLHAVEQDWDFIGVELPDHLRLLPAVLLHAIFIIVTEENLHKEEKQTKSSAVEK